MASTPIYVEAPATGKIVDACYDGPDYWLLEFENGVIKRKGMFTDALGPKDAIGLDLWKLANAIDDANKRQSAAMERRFRMGSSSRSCVCDAFGPCSVHAGRGRY